MEWIIRECDDDAAADLAKKLDIHEITAKVLLNRGIDSPDTAKEYLSPSLADMPDPFELPDLEQAAVRISDAIAGDGRIAIFGDYDVDGITGTALVTLFLRELGRNPRIMLPKRIEGYGLTESSITKLKEMKTDLLITIDNGTRATGALKLAADLGMDVIVTDHHEIAGEIPEGTPLINPHRLNGSHALKNLSGCGVAFMLAMGLRRHLRERGSLKVPEPNLKKHLDLVALGTIADVMPLTGINRTLVKYGLNAISDSGKPGIRALLETSCTKPADIGPGSVAFRLAPRLNAAGRLGDPEKSLELLLCSDAARASTIAVELETLNRQRQQIEQGILSDAERMMDEGAGLEMENAIVMDSKGWHIGVIGIVAAKIAERTSKPTIIISHDTSPARGSVRSIAGLDAVEALSACEGLLEGYGGHAMAAGLSIDKSKIGELKGRFDEICGKLAPKSLRPTIGIDAVAKPSDITSQLVQELVACQPFGQGNPEPVLLLNDTTIIDRRIVGDNHLKLTIGADAFRFSAIGFGMGDRLAEDAMGASVAFFPQHNDWNGMRTVQLKMKDIRQCSK